MSYIATSKKMQSRLYSRLSAEEEVEDDADIYPTSETCTDSDFEPELPPGILPEALHVRSDSTSTNASFTSSCSNNSFRSSSSQSRNRFLFPDLDIVEALRPEEVRWLYKDTAVDKKWTPFIGYDSLRIECKYRETLQTLGNVVIDSTEAEGEVHTDVVEDTERVIVRGGLYEVDVIGRKCHPIYWTQKADILVRNIKSLNDDIDEPTVIMRGTWFIHNTWQPLEETYANQIEAEHLAKFENQKLLEEISEPTKGLTPVVHNIQFTEFHVDWNSVSRVFLHYETASSKFYRAVGTKLGLNKSGRRLHRGYSSEARMDDKPPDISHLVFVVHGIGQKMDTSSIIKSCKEFRAICNKLKDKYFPDLDEANKRVEFLPVEWRSLLKLDGDTVESITPSKLKGLRNMLNSSAMDILYYTSPLYRSEITQGLQTELDKLYDMFCTRHPYFEAGGGKVSIVAHSLGCVITYDIITGWNPIQLYDQYVSSYIEEKCQQVEDCPELISELEQARQKVNDIEQKILKIAENRHMTSPTLKFKLENFFCLGSPLAVFLALRGVRPHGATNQDPVLPRSLCKRLYNVYHPSDPVAYRLEPLILKHYQALRPLRIHRADAAKKDPYDKLRAVPMAPERQSTVTDKVEVDGGSLAEDLVEATERVVGGTIDEVDEDEDDDDDEPEVAVEVKVTDEDTNSNHTTTSNNNTSSTEDKGRRWAFIWRRNKKNDSLRQETGDKEDSAPPRIDKTRIDKPPAVERQMSVDGRKSLEAFKKALEMKKPTSNQFQSFDNVSVDEAAPELDHRIDFMLREGKMEHAYLAALTSHTSYWLNQDIAMFVMSQIFQDFGPK